MSHSIILWHSRLNEVSCLQAFWSPRIYLMLLWGTPRDNCLSTHLYSPLGHKFPEDQRPCLFCLSIVFPALEQCSQHSASKVKVMSSIYLWPYVLENLCNVHVVHLQRIFAIFTCCLCKHLIHSLSLRRILFYFSFWKFLEILSPNIKRYLAKYISKWITNCQAWTDSSDFENISWYDEHNCHFIFIHYLSMQLWNE